MKSKRRNSFIAAVDQNFIDCESASHHGKSRRSYPITFYKIVNAVALNFLDDPDDRKYYADSYSCSPPPLFILTITIIELAFFTYYSVESYGRIGVVSPIPVDSVLIYRPDKRTEIWRFFFYIFLHAGWVHLTFNLLVQVLIGLPLEMVHGSLRIGAVYMAGVLAGSLGTSVFDPDVKLVGASGGVYALLTAHFANVVLNYNQMELGLLRIFGVFFVASADVGFAIYGRYVEGKIEATSYIAHLAGASAGLTLGLIVLKNFEQSLHKQVIWWLSLGIYIACMSFAILYNLSY
ncbi:protein rhomboid-like [Brevipalpus obovatus]|uniref:protein rhomboid-like n=1 Tax=Brevipalpus obovatus TaxID=246614 RepID=UPI003D9E5747